MDKSATLLDLVKRTHSDSPEVAAEAKAELEAQTVQFKSQHRSGVETR